MGGSIGRKMNKKTKKKGKKKEKKGKKKKRKFSISRPNCSFFLISASVLGGGDLSPQKDNNCEKKFSRTPKKKQQGAFGHSPYGDISRTHFLALLLEQYPIPRWGLAMGHHLPGWQPTLHPPDGCHIFRQQGARPSFARPVQPRNDHAHLS